MQLTRLATVLALLLAAPAARSLEIDEQTAGVRLEFFADSDDVHVFSNIGEYEISLSGESRVFLGWNRERVVVPAITAAPGSQEAVDAISGASRPVSPGQDPYSDFTKIRNQLDTTFRFRDWSAGYYVSSETDYFAQRVSGRAERTFLSDHLTLSLGGSWGWDEIRPLEDDDTATAPDRKTAAHASFVATQVVGPTTIVQTGLEWTGVKGLQHNPYRNVYVAGANTPERHPSERSRRDAFFKVSQYLSNRSSLKLSYKIYDDDWGIGSHTINAKLNQYVGDDVVVRHRYRWYSQSAADFFREQYPEPGGVNGYRTADYRLGEFDAHLFGTKLSWNLGRGPIPIEALDGVRMSLKYERYFNSNNFSANIFESGLALSF